MVKTAPKISDLNLYDIDDLANEWAGDWRKLAKWGEQLSDMDVGYFLDKERDQTKLVQSCFEGIVYEIQRDKYLLARFYRGQLISLAAAPDGKFDPEHYLTQLPGFRTQSAEEDKRLRDALRKITTAFSASKTVGEAIRKVATPRNYKKFTEWYIKRDGEAKLAQALQLEIESHWASAMKWLRKGLRSRAAFEKSFWNCVWSVAEPRVRDLSEIKRRIEAGVPLKEEHLATMNELSGYGVPFISLASEQDGREGCHILLRPRLTGDHPPGLGPIATVVKVAHALLAAPTFLLAQELREKLRTPKFRRQCRAPSCGKSFYTGRKDATACHGSQGYKKNECALEWVRYKRYLTKIGKDPEKDWENKQLKKNFISYDQS